MTILLTDPWYLACLVGLAVGAVSFLGAWHRWRAAPALALVAIGLLLVGATGMTVEFVR